MPPKRERALQPGLVGASAEILSRGGHSVVSLITSADSQKYPGADLLKVEEGYDPTWARRYALQMRAAHLIIPGHIAEVVATEMDPPLTDSWDEVEAYAMRFPVIRTSSNQFTGTTIDQGQVLPTPDQAFPLRTYRMFLKRLEVDPDHAIFSIDTLTIDSQDKHRSKRHSDCKCEVCVSHREVHADVGFRSKLEELKELIPKYQIASYAKYGWGSSPVIKLPYEDETDYCLRTEGRMVFFESDGINAEAMRGYLSEFPVLSNEQQELLHITNEYERLDKLAWAISGRYLGGRRD